MAYQTFIPTVEAAEIQHELERACVMAEDCNRQYEGDVKEKGDKVKILGIGKPTIRTLARSSASGNINGPEEIEGQDVFLTVDEIRYFNYMVGDIDERQARGGLMPAIKQETGEGLANEVDKYISAFALDGNVKKLNNSPVNAAGDSTNVLYIIDDAIQKLRENDVSGNTKIVLTAPPRFTKLIKQKLIGTSTNNPGLLEHGVLTTYGNVVIKESNNVATSSDGAVDNIMIRTQRAIAFVQQMAHIEAYRPELKFADAVKGFILFGGKVVRPKEIININVKYTA